MIKDIEQIYHEPKYHMTQKEMLEDLLLTYIKKIRMNILESVADLDDFEGQVIRRFKKRGHKKV